MKSFSEIAGGSRVVLDKGEVAVSRLDLGTRAKSDATVVINGGSLGAIELIDVGEYSDSHGSLVIHGGRLCATQLGIGGFNEGGGESSAFRRCTGKIIRNESDIGAWPAYKGGEAPCDSDDDGIPDASEKMHGLNPNDPDDANRITADGCTNLEHYLNNLVATHP